MEKNKMVAVVVAVMLVAVAAVGVILYLGSNGGDKEYDTGILMVHGDYDYEFVPMDTDGVHAASAFYTAHGISPPEGALGASTDINDWTLWVIPKGGSGWVAGGDPLNTIVSEHDGVAWSLTGNPPAISVDANNISLFTLIGSKERIVCLSPSITEIMAALGEDKIVGVDDWSDYPKSIADNEDIKRVGSYWGEINFELIVAANPDLVISDGDAFGQDIVANTLRDVGIQVLSISGHKGSIEGVCQNIHTIGLVTKTLDKANELVKEIIGVSVALKEIVDDFGLEDRKVLVIMPPDPTTVLVAGEWGTMGSAIMTIGLEVAMGLETSWTPWPGISTETVLNDGSDAYFVIVMSLYMPFTYADLAAHSVLGGIPAIQEGRVCIIDEGSRADSILSRSGPGVMHVMGILGYLATLDWSGITGGVTIGNDYMDYLDTLGVF